VADVKAGNHVSVQRLLQTTGKARVAHRASEPESKEKVPVVETEGDFLVQGPHEVGVGSHELTSEQVDVLAAEAEHLAVDTSVHSVVVAVGHAEQGLVNDRGGVAEETEEASGAGSQRTARDVDARDGQTKVAQGAEGRGDHSSDGEQTSGLSGHVGDAVKRVATQTREGEAGDGRTVAAGEVEVEADLGQGALGEAGEGRGHSDTASEGSHHFELHQVAARPVQRALDAHLARDGAAARGGLAAGGRAAAAARGLATSGLAASRGLASAGRRLAASRGLASAGRRLATGRGPALRGRLAATGRRLATGGGAASRRLAATGRRLAPRGGAPLGRSLAPRRRATSGRLAAAGGRLTSRGSATRRRLAARGRASAGDFSSGHVVHFPFVGPAALGRLPGWVHNHQFLKSHRTTFRITLIDSPYMKKIWSHRMLCDKNP
jgi:hypothetical protein